MKPMMTVDTCRVVSSIDWFTTRRSFTTAVFCKGLVPGLLSETFLEAHQIVCLNKSEDGETTYKLTITSYHEKQPLSRIKTLDMVEPYKLLTYTFQLSRSGVNVLVPSPQMLPPWQTPFLSFTIHLWIAVSVVFCIGVGSVWLVEKIRNKIFTQSNRRSKTFSESVLTIIGFFMEQNASMHNDLIACIFLYTSLLFAGYMVSNMYGAGLACVMTIPLYEKSIETPKDLADSGMLWGAEVVAWVNSFTLASESYLQTLVKNYRVEDLDHLKQLAKTRDFGFVGEHSEFGHFVPTEFLDEQTSSEKRLLSKDLLWQSCTAYVSKTFPFKSQLNDLIMDIRQSGVQHYWELRAVNRYLGTNLQRNILRGHLSGTDSEAEILTVSHFLGAFFLLTLGPLISK
ncbi:uncharacterized protein LOC120417136 [Culex pipiens pallens]|uniref:uncharacterized protein LOC120417136 n=1 Tax=Culex pipiens pallens TaxID=42434 RepID=UPI0022AA6033|nr:uncharacterized protein LOC120417136 [Culex pipiens pallens]